jgi:hypothetical protein
MQEKNDRTANNRNNLKVNGNSNVCSTLIIISLKSPLSTHLGCIYKTQYYKPNFVLALGGLLSCGIVQESIGEPQHVVPFCFLWTHWSALIPREFDATAWTAVSSGSRFYSHWSLVAVRIQWPHCHCCGWGLGSYFDTWRLKKKHWKQKLYSL